MEDAVIHTEDVVQALLDYLVEPLLQPPVRSSSVTDRSPTPSQQENMAKQMHGVVLLYNYYHRKQFQHLEFLDFESFCKVSVNAKPKLLVYMGLMQKCSSESNELEKILSVTEKAIMDACNICLGLDASRDVPCMEKWPVSKVVVFLIDKMKKNCLLMFGSVTQGVWSPLEKNIDNSNDNPGDSSKLRKTDQNKSATEVNFDQLALSAVKEETGIDQTDLMILESHVVPSLSTEKTSARFYLLRCIKTLQKDVISIPIDETMICLQGPLAKSLGSLGNIISAVVEYFHLLPYAGILSEWLSRTGQETEIMESSPTMNHSDTIDDGSSDILGNKTSNTTTVNQEENFDGFTRGVSGDDLSVVRRPSKGKNIPIQSKVSVNPADRKRKFSIEGDPSIAKNGRKYKVDKVDKVDLVVEPCNNMHSGGKAAYGNNNGNIGLLVQEGIPSADHPVLSQSNSEGPDKVHAILSSKGNTLLNAAVRALHKKRDELVDKVDKVDLVIEPMHSGAKASNGNDNGNIGEPCNNGRSAGKAAYGNNNGNIGLPVQEGIPSADHPVLSQSNSEGPDKIHAILSSKGNALLNAAVRALHKKRGELSQEQRYLQDEIALCEQNLQKILSGGDDLKLNLDCIIEACNSECYTRSTRSHVDTHQNSVGGSTPHMKMNKLSEAILCLRNPCQDLDEICCKNNWALPRYNVLPSNGEFHAKVTSKGMDFEFSVGGEPHADPREARKSAAANMLTKLRSTADLSKPTKSQLLG